jgi:hypothetical protein
MGDRPASELNENQRRHILATCEYIDRLLTDLDTAIAAAASGSPFARYLGDLTAAQAALLREHSAGIRGQMLRMLQGLGISPGTAATSLRHAIRTSLGFIDIALEEMKPQYMRGYGEMPAAAVPELNNLASELQALVQRLDGALAQGPAAAAPPDAQRIETELRNGARAIADVRRICERVDDSWTAITGEALDLAAETASKALDWPDDAPGGIDEVVRAAVTKVGSDHTEDIRLALANLIAKLRATLASASRSLGLPEPAGAQGWTETMPEMPQFVAPELRVNLRLFLRRALGSSSAHARVRRAIEAQAGEQVGQALANHGALLREWASRVLTRTEQQFEAQAAVCRAHLDAGLSPQPARP